ncbi:MULTISPECIES: hypothetical protein [unclassified Streptomyces]|uniref:hypothetical protein n=1 Tax=unclassified Streptomyces TaxID=2593676 RepID=UPI002119CEE1|nr:hypothetical protein [Streptomyces sp. 13-12-16]
MGNGDVSTDVAPQDSGHNQPLQTPLDLPLDFEAFHQGFFHDFAEIHLGSRRTAEQVVHEVFPEILGSWEELLQQGVTHRGVAGVLMTPTPR